MPDAVKLRILSSAESELIDEVIELERRTYAYAAPEPVKDDNKADATKTAEVKADKEAQAKKSAESLAARKTWLSGLASKAQSHANDPVGWRLLADAQCRSDDAKACMAAADRALALAPQDSRAKLRKAEAMLDLAKDNSKAEADVQIKAARALIVEANRADPDDPLPLLAFYQSYGAAGMRAPDAAIEGLKQVVITIPQFDGPRLMLANELIDRKQTVLAKSVLKPLAFSPHDTSSRKSALALLARLEETDEKETTD